MHFDLHAGIAQPEVLTNPLRVTRACVRAHEHGHDLGLVLDQCVDEGERGLGGGRRRDTDPFAIDRNPVALPDRPTLSDGVPHGLGDLSGGGSCHRFRERADVGLQIRIRVVPDERAQRLDHRMGRHDRDGLLRECIHLARHGHDVLVVRQDDHRVRRTPFHCLKDLRGRRVHGLTTGHDLLHAEAGEQPAHTVTHADRDDRGLDHVFGRVHDGFDDRRVVRDPLLFPELFEEIGDADFVRPAGLDPGLDRATDVVGVHVTVPGPVSADHHDRIAKCSPRALERRDGAVGRVEEVHDFVPQQRHVSGRRVRAHDGGCRTFGRERNRPPVHHLEKRIEQQGETLPTGIHHAGVAQDRQHLRRLRDRVAGGHGSVVEDVHQTRRSLALRAFSGLGRPAHDGQNGPLDRPHHGLVRGVRRRPQGGRDLGRAGGIAPAERVGQSPKDLGQNDAGVAARAHQRTV